jgi:hypothetical protein
MSAHRIQPIITDEHGTPRFKENSIVRYLLDEGEIDLNHIARKDFPVEDREQFAQLIGYSLGGFAELSYVTNDTYAAAEKMACGGITEEQARIASLEEILANIREGLRAAAGAAFHIHPNDLQA